MIIGFKIFTLSIFFYGEACPIFEDDPVRVRDGSKVPRTATSPTAGLHGNTS